MLLLDPYRTSGHFCIINDLLVYPICRKEVFSQTKTASLRERERDGSCSVLVSKADPTWRPGFYFTLALSDS
jgi:hypothetical protein